MVHHKFTILYAAANLDASIAAYLIQKKLDKIRAPTDTFQGEYWPCAGPAVLPNFTATDISIFYVIGLMPPENWLARAAVFQPEIHVIDRYSYQKDEEMLFFRNYCLKTLKLSVLTTAFVEREKWRAANTGPIVRHRGPIMNETFTDYVLETMGQDIPPAPWWIEHLRPVFESKPLPSLPDLNTSLDNLALCRGLFLRLTEDKDLKSGGYRISRKLGPLDATRAEDIRETGQLCIAQDLRKINACVTLAKSIGLRVPYQSATEVAAVVVYLGPEFDKNLWNEKLIPLIAERLLAENEDCLVAAVCHGQNSVTFACNDEMAFVWRSYCGSKQSGNIVQCRLRKISSLGLAKAWKKDIEASEATGEDYE